MSYKFNIFTSNFDITGAGSSTDPQLRSGITCNAAVAVGDWVTVATGTAEKAQANSVANSDAIGVVESKDAPTSCTVRIGGCTSALFLALDPSKDYFLSATTAGGMVSETSVPTGSGQVVLALGKPLNATQLIVNIGQQLVRD